MDIVSIQKNILMSPKKLRFVARATKKLSPVEAVEMLPHISRRAAGPLVKVIKSALANAQEKGVNAEDLEFKEIQVNEGPRLKRGRSVSRGVLHPYKKRMSHIRVVLVTKSEVSASRQGGRNSKSETNKNTKTKK